MRNRIIKKKLIFLHHIANLDRSSLAYKIYEVQVRLALPGLVEECQPFLVRFGITNLAGYTKLQWKKLINEKLAQVNKSDLLEMMVRSKKLDPKKLADEDFEVKPYFKSLNLVQARIRFRIRSLMTKSVKMNYPSDPRYSRNLTCCHCEQIDSQSHILYCPGYEHLREHKNLDDDHDLVLYFQQVLRMREAME